MRYFLISLMSSLFFALCFFCKNRAEKKQETEGVIRTHMPKVLTVFLIGMTVITLGGFIAVAICLYGDEQYWIVMAVMGGLFLLSIACSVLLFFTYVVMDETSVTSYKAFRRPKRIPIERIRYIKDTIIQGPSGGLKAYDENRKRLFSIEAIAVGSVIVAQRLRERGAIDI